MKVRKKPVEVEAMLHSGLPTDTRDIRLWAGLGPINPDGSLTIHTLEGDMKAQVGDWVVRGVKGEFYPCKPDIFEKTYEVLES